MQHAFATFVVTLLSFQCIYVQGQLKDIVETAIENGNFKTLVQALTAADLVTALKGTGPFTVFAPNDGAFANLPNFVVEDLLKPENKDSLSRILQYHVTSGNLPAATINALTLPANVTMLAGGFTTVTRVGTNLFLNGVQVIMADVFATNGVIHVLNAVILPPLDIVETAITKGSFRTLVTALRAADLATTLKGAGPFTAFAPTDAAFGKLAPGALVDLLKPENKDKLANTLKYHVVSGKVMAGDLKPPQSVATLTGGKIEVTKDGDNIKINEATVVIADVGASNGVIHAIDTVLTPRGSSPLTSHSSEGLLIAVVSALFFFNRSSF